MNFDSQTVEKIARLARLNIPAEKQKKFIDEMNGIIGWIDQLKEVDVQGVAPLYSPLPEKTVWREDKITTGDLQADLMKNSPDAVHGFYVVPKVVE